MRNRNHRNNAAYFMVAVIIVLLIVASLGVVVSMRTSDDVKYAGSKSKASKLQYEAETAVGHALQKIIAEYSVIPQIDPAPIQFSPSENENHTVPTPIKPDSKYVFQYWINNNRWDVQYSIKEDRGGDEDQDTDEDTDDADDDDDDDGDVELAPAEDDDGDSDDDDPSNGWQVNDEGVSFKKYVIRAFVQDTASNESAALQQNVWVLQMMNNLANYFIFYDKDLEINPGACMTLDGPVHSNGNLYMTGSAGGMCKDNVRPRGLYLEDALTVGGHIFRGRKDYSDVSDYQAGLVNIQGTELSVDDDAIEPLPGFKPFHVSMPEYGDGNTDPDDTWAVDGNWQAFATSTWGGDVVDASHGDQHKIAPALGSLEPDGVMAVEADIKIVVRTGGSVDIYRRDSATPDAGLYAACGIGDDAHYWDVRQDMYVNMRKIDVSKLSSPACIGEKGIVYATREDAVPDPEVDTEREDDDTTEDGLPYGFRLINGEELGAPLTFVTNNPLTVKGSFNRQLDNDGEELPTGHWQPAALITADTLTLFSSAWDDDEHTLEASQPLGKKSRITHAAEGTTELNALLVASIRETTIDPEPPIYSGGLENFIKLHENWLFEISGDEAIIRVRGSLIALGEPVFDTAHYQGKHHYFYRPPDERDWAYEQRFSNPALQPPGIAKLHILDPNSQLGYFAYRTAGGRKVIYINQRKDP